MKDVSSYLDDKVFAKLRNDLLIDARERLDRMEAAAAETKGDGVESLALLTSCSTDHPEIRRLPEDVPVLHLSPSLADELADVVTKFGLT